MKIVHLCLGNLYIDNYAYQENMLPKFHKQLGFEVEIVASPESFDKDGKPCLLDRFEPYYEENGIKVTRLPFRSGGVVCRKLRLFKNVYGTLANAAPDIIFIHNGQFADIKKVVKYKKDHPEVTLYIDNHADVKNSATNWVSRNILHKIIWKRCERTAQPYVKKYYGVLPARVDFLINVYGISPEKCELLVMGGDDDIIEKVRENGARERVRSKYGVKDGDLLIMTGGKINGYRPEVLDLMRAVDLIGRENVKLVVFGVVDGELKAQFDSLLREGRVMFAGWQSPEGTYEMLEAADLVVFPGLHSVLWEQAVAQGKPCVFRDIEGFHHVDIGGNAVFIRDLSPGGMKKAIEEVTDDPDKFARMKDVAEKEGMKVFSYKDIARRSVL